MNQIHCCNRWEKVKVWPAINNLDSIVYSFKFAVAQKLEALVHWCLWRCMGKYPLGYTCTGSTISLKQRLCNSFFPLSATESYQYRPGAHWWSFKNTMYTICIQHTVHLFSFLHLKKRAKADHQLYFAQKKTYLQLAKRASSCVSGRVGEDRPGRCILDLLLTQENFLWLKFTMVLARWVMSLGCSWRKEEPTFQTPSLSALSFSETSKAAKSGSGGEAQPK